MDEKEINAYKDGFLNGMDCKSNFKYTLFGYDLHEVLKIVGDSKMREKAKMTRAEAVERISHFIPNRDNAEGVVGFYIEAGMLEVVEEEKRKIMLCNIDGQVSTFDLEYVKQIINNG